MQKKLFIPLIVTVTLGSALNAFSLSDATSMATSASSMMNSGASMSKNASLTSTLMSGLGVTKQQATGGTGAILQYAKNSLNSQDFSKVASSIPNANALLAAAPAVSKAASKAKGISSLASSFSSLGMSSGMVQKFVPLILGYLQTSGKSGAMGLLKNIL